MVLGSVQLFQLGGGGGGEGLKTHARDTSLLEGESWGVLPQKILKSRGTEMLFFNILNKIFTGLPVVRPSYKMGLVFPSGTSHTLVCSAHAQVMRVHIE